MLATSASAVVTTCNDASSVGVIVDGFNVNDADAYLSAMKRRDVRALLAVTPSALKDSGMPIKIARAIAENQDIALRYSDDATVQSDEELSNALADQKKLFRENGVKLEYVLFNHSNDDALNERLTVVAANDGLIAVAFDINAANVSGAGEENDELSVVLKSGLKKVSKKEKKNQGHIVLLSGEAPKKALATIEALVKHNKKVHLHLKSFARCVGDKKVHSKLLKAATKKAVVVSKEAEVDEKSAPSTGVVVVGAKLSKKEAKIARKVAAQQKRRQQSSDSEQVDPNEFIPKRFLGQSKKSDEDEDVDGEDSGAVKKSDDNSAATTLFSSSILSLSVAIGASILAFL